MGLGLCRGAEAAAEKLWRSRYALTVTLGEVYGRRLSAELNELPDQCTLDEVFLAARGAFPSDVLANRPESPVGLRIAQLLRDVEDSPPHSSAHEPHPLDFDWRFDQRTQVALTRLLNGMREKRIVCLGTPTIAYRLAGLGHQVVLIDNNALADARPDSLEVLTGDVACALALGAADLVVVDPPWYPDQMTRWLQLAVELLSVGGQLWTSMFGELLRPRAATERTELMTELERIGQVEVDRDLLRYETPRFEYEALKAQGILLGRPWRRADLVRFVLKTEPRSDLGGDRFDHRRSPASVDGPVWDSFRICGQSVRTRLRGDTVAGAPLAQLSGCVGFVLPTVSMRDPRRAEIDVWSSRNRVAACGDRARLNGMLLRLEAAASEAEVRDLVAIDSTWNEAEQRDLIRFLDME